MAKFNYIELPVSDLPAVRDFYSAAFGFAFTDYGPEYAATSEGTTALGLNADPDQQTATLLPLMEVEDLEAALDACTGAGGVVTQPIFAFPGGRRFHFRDPAGFEIGVFVNEG